MLIEKSFIELIEDNQKKIFIKEKSVKEKLKNTKKENSKKEKTLSTVKIEEQLNVIKESPIIDKTYKNFNFPDKKKINKDLEKNKKSQKEDFDFFLEKEE